MSSGGGGKRGGAGRGVGGGGWRGRGRGSYVPWKRGGGRGGAWKSRGKGSSNSQSIMAPPSQTSRTTNDFDDLDSESRLSQTPQFQGVGLNNNVGKLIQTQLTFEDGDCFAGWDLYFPTTAFDESAPAVSAVKNFIKYFQAWSQLYTVEVEKIIRHQFVEVLYR